MSTCWVMWANYGNLFTHLKYWDYSQCRKRVVQYIQVSIVHMVQSLQLVTGTEFFICLLASQGEKSC